MNFVPKSYIYPKIVDLKERLQRHNSAVDKKGTTNILDLSRKWYFTQNVTNINVTRNLDTDVTYDFDLQVCELCDTSLNIDEIRVTKHIRNVHDKQR